MYKCRLFVIVGVYGGIARGVRNRLLAGTTGVNAVPRAAPGGGGRAPGQDAFSSADVAAALKTLPNAAVRRTQR